MFYGIIMKTSSKPKTLPEVMLNLQHLGQFIRVARKRRRLTLVDVGNRVNLSYQTMVRIERGDPSVSVAAYMSVLWLFDLGTQMTAAVHPDQDAAGKQLEASRLPVRVGTKKAVRSEHDF